MKKIALTLLSVPLTLLALGCGKSGTDGKTAEGSAGSVAIVDLDGVAKAMGWQEDMKSNLEATKKQIGEQLLAALKPSQQALEAKREEVKKAANLNASQMKQLDEAKSKADLEALGLSSKEVEELMQAFAVAYQNAQMANNTLNQAVQAQQQKLVQTYREAVKPSIRRVAEKNNKALVFSEDPGLILFTDKSAADLTDKIVDDLQQNKIGKIELPAAPPLNITQPPAASATTRPK